MEEFILFFDIWEIDALNSDTDRFSTHPQLIPMQNK